MYSYLFYFLFYSSSSVFFVLISVRRVAHKYYNNEYFYAIHNKNLQISLRITPNYFGFHACWAYLDYQLLGSTESCCIYTKYTLS